MISIRIHKSCRDVVAICDTELLGKYFEEGNKQLDVKESFYKGKELDIEKAKEIMMKQKIEDATFNIVGEKSIKAAIKAGIIDKRGIKKIKGVPFALTLL